MSVVERFHELVAHRGIDVGQVYDMRSDVAAADPQQGTGRTGLQEHVQAVQVSAHPYESGRLLQTGNEGAV
jgi:hypothetical protein